MQKSWREGHSHTHEYTEIYLWRKDLQMRKVSCELGFDIKAARNRKIHILPTAFICFWVGLPIFWRKKSQKVPSFLCTPGPPAAQGNGAARGEDGHDRCPSLSQSSQFLHRVSGLESTLPICSSGCRSSSWGSFQWSRKGNVLRTLVHLLLSRQVWWEWPPPSRSANASGARLGLLWAQTGWAMVHFRVGGECPFWSWRWQYKL